MKSRTLVVVTALVLALVAPTAAQASSARIAGLSVPADLVRDEVGSFTYLSALASQGNLLWVEPGNGGNEGAGAVLQNLWGGRYGTWAVSVRRFAPALGQAMYLDPIGPSGVPPFTFMSDPNTTGQSLDLSWARTYGNRTLGLRYQRSFQSRETVAGTTEGDGPGSRNVNGLAAGIGFPFHGHDHEVAVHWQHRTFQGSSAATPDVAGSTGGTSWLVAARRFQKGSDGVTWIPAVKAYQFNLDRDDAAGALRKLQYSGWQVGLAGNWAISGDDLFVFGAQFASNRRDQIDPTATFKRTENLSPAVFMALESKVQPWLTLRFGARNTLFHSVKDDNSGPLTPPSSTGRFDTFAFNMGASVKLGTLTLDAVLAPDFYDGSVNAVINDGLGTAPFPQVSVGYAF
ncbi:MAG: hypothetical protein ACKO3S_05515 [bacterium]